MGFSNEGLRLILNDFLTLKKIRRTGWQLRGIKDCESLADHCYGVVLLTYLLIGNIDQKIDKEKAIAMSIIHELGECRVGDIPFPALKYFQNKSEIEQIAVKDVLSPLGAELTDENFKLFKEFEEGLTVEAKFVKAIDKFEMLVTAAEYEKSGTRSLMDFWENDKTFEYFNGFPLLKEYALKLKNDRKERLGIK